nr:hypothetical protein [Planococcus glaciei]
MSRESGRWSLDKEKVEAPVQLRKALEDWPVMALFAIADGLKRLEELGAETGH